MGFGGDVSGEVLSINVKVGDVVESGTVLATLDDVDLQRDVEDAQVELDRAVDDREDAIVQWEQDVADAEKALADAERDLTIARLEYSDTSLEEARVNLKWAQKGESDTKSDYEKAQTNWPPIPVDSYRDSWHRAIDERELSEMRLADAENAYKVQGLELQGYESNVDKAGRDLAALEGGIEASYDRAVEDAQKDLDRAKEALEHAQIVAPWRATVLAVNVSPGTIIDSSTAVITLLNMDEGLFFVTQDLSEQHIANIYPGQRAIVTLRTFADEPIQGTVDAVVPQSGETEADAYFTVYVRLDSTELRLLPGLTGRVEIYTGE
jgi:multidrug resistance efflux pump